MTLLCKKNNVAKFKEVKDNLAESSKEKYGYIGLLCQ
jgi:hypothetical protein